MSIVTESNVPNLILQLNAVQKQINYRGVIREISDTYWNDEILPLLYPNWDTDKDKLINFLYYDTGAFLARRRKFVKNFSTGEYYWKDYEMERYEVAEATEIFEKLKEAFYLIDSTEREDFQKELAQAYADTKTVSWFGVRLVRNFLLQDSDWVFAGDSPIADESVLANWRTYRAKLRELPQVDEYTEAIDVKFPISPDDFDKFYSPQKPDEAYLSTDDQFLKLSGFFIMHFKERMIQYLMIKQSLTSPLNYKKYRDQMAQLPIFKAPELSEAELKKLVNHLPDDRTGDPVADSEKFVDSILLALSETTEIPE
jgi:hypothetical protein